MAHSRQLVLGLGNPLAGDDGFGVAVVERLRQSPELLHPAEIRDAGTDLLGLIDVFGGFEHVILVDAVVGRSPAGHVAAVAEAEFTAWPAQSTGCHGISPLEAVHVFHAIYPDRSTRFTLIAMHSDGIRLGSRIEASAVERGVDLVTRMLRELPGGRPAPPAR